MNAAAILALIPGFIEMIGKLVALAKTATGTPEEEKAKLDAISADLKLVAAAVAAVQLPDKV